MIREKNQDTKPYLAPATKLLKSHTEGEDKLRDIGNCFTNLPKISDIYIRRNILEDELANVLQNEERFPIITLLGKGGIGKTSLTLNQLYRTIETDRFDLILWFSSRDIDLLLDGAKQVRPQSLNIKDIAKEYCSLTQEKISSKEIEDYFAKQLGKNEWGKTLYVFDNFETLTNPIEVFEWINTYIRNPNKILITSRISRDFRGDYPIEILGMKDTESRELIHTVAQQLEITHLLTEKYINKLVEESDGHPYIIKILLGEVAKTKKASSIKRIVANQDKILTVLFKRTFNGLSPVAKRVFLTLCSWNTMIPIIALKAVLWRPKNEKMDVEAAIEELRKSSFIQIITENEDEVINVPLAAMIFGRTEFEVYPEKLRIKADKKLLMEFGTTSHTNIKFSRNISKKFKNISKRIKSVEEFQKELPVLEYIASQYPKTYTYIIQMFEEYEIYDKVKYFIREYLKNDLVSSEKQSYWTNIANICKHTEDWNGEIHALTEIIQIRDMNLMIVSDTVNRINHLIYNISEARKDEYKVEFLLTIIQIFEDKINGDIPTATDYSRLGWLLLNANKLEKARVFVKKGLSLDSTNIHCQRLQKRLS